ncbi:MAG TPA: ferrochelatase [Candidatus Polarisedimenticolaceae bacterium]|nr:ferrochelatase [Candidatus Polarisedimenticolaceae bacterium]
MTPAEQTGLLLINLGTPDSPRSSDVRRYLREFLSDPRVLDIPAWKRWLVLNLLILPFRPRRSGEAYAKIWTAQGSPLLQYGRELLAAMRQRLEPGVLVELGMRYGQPSIGEALQRLRRRGVRRIVAFPLYPQYSSAATGSSLEHLFGQASACVRVPYVQVVPPFYDHPAYIDAFAQVARPVIERVQPELVYFSFHGLPERQVARCDPTGGHCFQRPDCCEKVVAANRDCYRAQCHVTARLLAERLGVPEPQRRICFQSRLGRDPWIKPYTDLMLVEDARAGVRRAVILSPGFVADCLETLEELGLRGAASWRENGGELLELVPSLNATPAWADAAVRIAREQTTWLGQPTPAARAAVR